MGMVRSLPAAVSLSLIIASVAAADAESRDPLRAPPGQYELDKRHASLIVRVVHMGFSHYTMRFTSLGGGFSYDPANWVNTKVTITVDPKSIDTEDGAFNKTVAGYFEPDKYPVIQFTSTTLKTTREGEGDLTGDLSLHGVTRPVTLKVVFNGAGPGLLGAGTRMGFSGVGRIKRSDFLVSGGRPWAGDDVDLMFEVEFVRKPQE